MLTPPARVAEDCSFRAVACGLRCGPRPRRPGVLHVLLPRALRGPGLVRAPLQTPAPCQGCGVRAWVHPHVPRTAPEPRCLPVPLPGREPRPHATGASPMLTCPLRVCPQASHGTFQPGLLPVSVSALQGVAAAARQYPRTGGPREESGVGCAGPGGQAGRVGGQGAAGQHLPAAAAGWGWG